MKFPRSRRITNRGDFQRVRKEGESVKGSFLVLGHLFDSERVTDQLKVGYITTKRIGNAVARTKLRKKLRGILQRTGEEICEGHFLVLIARFRAATATSEQLEKEWRWMLKKAKLLKNVSHGDTGNTEAG